MAISFTGSIIARLKKEIADTERELLDRGKKKEKALFKINQLEKDIKLSYSPSDLSSKMTRISKLKAEISKINGLQTTLSKQLVMKKASLNKLLSKD